MQPNTTASVKKVLPNSYIQSSTSKPELPQIISLFCGAGGLDWGFHAEGFCIPLAIDLSEAAIRTHKRNFAHTHSVAADLIELGPRGVLRLAKERIPIKSSIGLIGGPPCQGFSRANTGSQPDDPRNELPALYLEIVRQLKKHYSVEFVVFENVLGIRDKKHADTYRSILNGLDELGLDVTEKELCSLDFGVPQNRRRIVLSAMRKRRGYAKVVPQKKRGLTTVREAIGHLAPPAYFARDLDPGDIPVHQNHWTMRPKSPRFLNPSGPRIDGRSFKQLDWDEPSPTIAFGHREIYVHPTGTRRLSIYEAMLLQGFPKGFVLEGNLSEQVEQVSNAVPPPLGRSIAAAVKQALSGI
ncbi:DNA cytosine methyltransferase [Pandoraea apista]|uniref:DNA cytosine methyltransferase n=1 Tax=Pandoraea apista TaxID=93218 RepID=UPI000F65969A|nr:DNA cytosine methyltransferase [Pandoraea apista]RRW94702.1 DNA cytosine methyltransferase [Pandoraea apista]RRX03011.1 DNA cytosine methyltransferase [Pandoraea apista]